MFLGPETSPRESRWHPRWLKMAFEEIQDLKETELKIIFQQFCLIQHEYIEPMVRIDSGDCSTIMIQKYNDKLISLRDYIYGQVIVYFLIISLLLF